MRKSTLLLGALSLLCALSALWSWQELHRERVRTADLEQELAASLARSTQVHQSTVTVAEKPPANSSPAAVRSAPPHNPAPRKQDVRQLIREAAQREKEMLRDPAYRSSVMEQHRRRFARTRADAIRVAGMTPAQADRVIDLSVERNLRFSDLGGVPGEPPDESMQAELKRAGDAEQADLRSLLGEEKYEQWRRYLSSGQERAEMDQFRLQLPASVQPLSDSQVDVLVDTIYSERQRSSREYENYVQAAGITNRFVVSADDRQHYLDFEHAANQRVHDAVSATLSREQLAALDEVLKARLAPSEAALRMQLEGKLVNSD